MVYRRDPNILERKIHFFRADIGVDDGGQALFFDPLPALRIINRLRFTDDEAGRYKFESDGNALCLVDYFNGNNLGIRFGRIRRTGLPQLEQAGNITDLDLPPDSGLLETIHIVFFPDNIVGAEYNHYGPRLSQIGSYFHEKSGGVVPDAAFHPILRRNATEQLERLSEIRLLSMSIRPAYAAVMRQANQSLGDAFVAAGRVLDNPETIELVIKSQRETRQAGLIRLRNPLRNLLRRNDFSENTERLQIRGKCQDTDRVETIDLLKDQLISIKRIIRLNERGKALNAESAFRAIHEAYGDLEGDLQMAAGVAPDCCYSILVETLSRHGGNSIYHPCRYPCRLVHLG